MEMDCNVDKLETSDPSFVKLTLIKATYRFVTEIAKVV